jgi:hypothetical protein
MMGHAQAAHHTDRRDSRILRLVSLERLTGGAGRVPIDPSIEQLRAVMDQTQTRATIIAFLERALEFAGEINDSTTAYLIERALDEARSQQLSQRAGCC